MLEHLINSTGHQKQAIQHFAENENIQVWVDWCGISHNRSTKVDNKVSNDTKYILKNRTDPYIPVMYSMVATFHNVEFPHVLYNKNKTLISGGFKFPAKAVT